MAKKNVIFCEENAHATITPSVDMAAFGEVVELDIKIENGYELDKITVNNEVIDNFVSVKKMQKITQPTTASTLTSLSPTVSTTPTTEEAKKIFTPKVRTVTRKRPLSSIEEKEKRLENPSKMRLIQEEDSYYLKINSDNLQMMKDHLEVLKMKMKELKEKKKTKKKS